MFNRAIKLTVVKDKTAKNEVPTPPTDYTQLAVDLGKKAVVGTIIVLAVYISLDTARQVTVLTTASKL